jgi:hypothetical protein
MGTKSREDSGFHVETAARDVHLSCAGADELSVIRHAVNHNASCTVKWADATPQTNTKTCKKLFEVTQALISQLKCANEEIS